MHSDRLKVMAGTAILSSFGQSTVWIFLVAFVSINEESLSTAVTVGDAFSISSSKIAGCVSISEIEKLEFN